MCWRPYWYDDLLVLNVLGRVNCVQQDGKDVNDLLGSYGMRHSFVRHQTQWDPKGGKHGVGKSALQNSLKNGSRFSTLEKHDPRRKTVARMHSCYEFPQRFRAIRELPKKNTMCCNNADKALERSCKRCLVVCSECESEQTNVLPCTKCPVAAPRPPSNMFCKCEVIMDHLFPLLNVACLLSIVSEQ
jgi:hypothetical protein